MFLMDYKIRSGLHHHIDIRMRLTPTNIASKLISIMLSRWNMSQRRQKQASRAI